MERSCRELLNNLIINRFIFKYNQITLFPCVTFIPKIGMGLPKTGINFYSARRFFDLFTRKKNNKEKRNSNNPFRRYFPGFSCQKTCFP